MKEGADEMTTTRDELTVTQAAERLGRHEDWVRDMCRRGDLRARKVPMDSLPYGRWAVDEESVDMYANQATLDIDALVGERAMATLGGEQFSVRVRGWMCRERNTVRVARLDSDGRTVVDARIIVDVHHLRPHPDGPEPEVGEFWYICSTCGQAQPEHDYYVVSSVRRHSECKACHRARNEIYRAANREKITERNRANWQAHREHEQAALREGGYIPAGEVQQRLGVSRQFVSSLAKRSKIRRHPSRHGWYDAASIERYIKERDT
jgi:hypothetical protein